MRADRLSRQDPLVLLVDDDRVALELCSRYLRRGGYDRLIPCERSGDVLSILSN